ncbi:MAG: ATP-grasp domain-containing protein [Bdellovibrionales bacterium]|nr:ATP-grasp domain-containing protein [Bdellovibrionales bacterium]
MDSILVANRGEIARRIFRTARRMGLRTIAVYSEADRLAPFVREAHESILLGASEASESYLNQERILEAAKSTKAEGIHPGYGFLSEKPEFAAAVESAGISFIGPAPDTIRLLGDKVQSRLLAEKLSIATVPGTHLKSITISSKIQKEILEKVGLPLIVKAAGGGGGRGMRIVREISELESALARASSEAKSFFNNEEVFLERYVEGARHVEIQFFGDSHGNVFILSERDCSLQRNHQKVIEEGPAVMLSESQRNALHSATRRLVQETHYRNAGTAEFLVSHSGEHYFLEVNSRLQVEHPVTESILGIDLVEAQIRAARGEDLSTYLPFDASPRGHAIELRLCAEKPSKSFQAATGRIEKSNLDELALLPGIRVDSGVEAGSTVSHFYDSLIGKIISFGNSREDARQQAIIAVRNLSFGKIETNAGLLLELLSDADFRSNTHSLFSLSDIVHRYSESAYSVHLAAHLRSFVEMTEPQNLPSSLLAFSLTPLGTKVKRAQVNGEPFEWQERALRASSLELETISGGETIESSLIDRTEDSLTVSCGGETLVAHFPKHASSAFLTVNGTTYSFEDSRPTIEGKKPKGSAHSGDIRSPLPGKILEICIPFGSEVSSDTVIFRLESMKMEHPIRSGATGILAESKVAAGDSVVAGQLLAKISPASP